MFKLSLSESSIYQAVYWERFLVFRWAPYAKTILGTGGAVLFILFLISFWGGVISDDLAIFILGLSLVALSFGLFFFAAELFFVYHLKNPKMQASLEESFAANAADTLSFEAAKAVDKCVRLMRRQKPPQVDSNALMYFLLEHNPDLGFIFFRANLDVKAIMALLQKEIFPPRGMPFSFSFWMPEEVTPTDDLQQTLREALLSAQERKHYRIEATDILIALSKHNSLFGDVLVQADLKPQDIKNLAWWLETLKTQIAQSKRFWDKKNLMRRGTLAKEWTAGYTIMLDKFGTDWTEVLGTHGFEEIIGHQKEIGGAERILEREEINNVLLVGEPGVGRRAVIHALAQKIFLGESLEQLNWKRVVELDMPALLARIENTEEVERILDQIFQECVVAGNVILVLEEFHNYVAGVMRPGALDISGVLAGYLHLPQFQIIATTSYMGLHKNIEANPSILSLFEKIEVQEPGIDEVTLILEGAALKKERRYNRLVTYPAIREIVEDAAKYIPGAPFPRKGLDLLDEVMVYVASYTKSSFVLPEHVEKVITDKTQIPVGRIQQKERDTLLNLESLIHQRLINQDEAVNEVAAALRRARTEVSSRKGPMGTFLFMGPTGVGKTETAKALAEIYFGAEGRMIRLDMSEFQNPQDLGRLLGSAEQEGSLTTPVREDPFSLLLLDEVEKAHPNILNLFLQVLDEGWVTDGLGRKVDFTNTIIIATSNAGYQIILEAIKSKAMWSGVKQKILDFLFEESIFRPEFINRFDAVVVFSPLSKDSLVQIAELMLGKIQKNLIDKGIQFEITSNLKDKIAELGYDPTFGARQMRRVVQDRVENALAKALLSEEIGKGDRIEVDAESFSVRVL